MGTGMLMPDLTLINELTQEGIPVDESAHVNEHSIENQLPFLQQLYPGIKLVPISVASINLEVVGRVGMYCAPRAAVHVVPKFWKKSCGRACVVC